MIPWAKCTPCITRRHLQQLKPSWNLPLTLEAIHDCTRGHDSLTQFLAAIEQDKPPSQNDDIDVLETLFRCTVSEIRTGKECNSACLNASEAHKVSVIVLDVTKPGSGLHV